MAEPHSSPKALKSPEAAKHPSVVTQLFDLAATQGLEVLLQKALSMAVQIFRAEAGSILFHARQPRRLRSGAFRPDTVARLQYWEETIGQRLQETVWKLPASAAMPISVTTSGPSRLVLVNVPLLSVTRVVGCLSLVLPPDCELTDYQRSLLAQLAQGMGQMATLAAELELTQQRLKQMEALQRIGQALVTTVDINKLLNDVMQLAASVIDAGAASLMLIDEEQGDLVFEVSHGSRSQMLRQQRIPMDEGIAGWVARNGRPVVANEARTDPRFSHRVDVRTGFLTQSIVAVPMMLKGRVLGVLEVLNKYSGVGFDDEDVQLLTSIAAHAAIALENARLYQQVRQERDLIIKAQEDVRRELARNLHDGPIQLLSAISMSLDHLQRLNALKPEAVENEIHALRNLVHQATRDTRNLLFELRPIILETQGLVAALYQYVAHLRTSENFTIHFKAVEGITFEARVAGTLFSIIQEAINNIKRHAEAHTVWLSLEVKNNRFVVTVRDDGCGFDLSKVDSSYDRRGSLGIINMRERAALIEAELQIESRVEPPNRGTNIQLVLPLPPEPRSSRLKTEPVVIKT